MQEAPYKIYSASAGSGKTYTLAKAYLKIVLSSPSHSFRKILAITFTNKAVNEMKQRILKSLFLFAQTNRLEDAPPMFVDLMDELQTDHCSLRKRAEKALKEILHNYAFFDVSTIDKFTHRLIRTFAKDLKLPQNFEVVLDTDLLLSEAVAKLLNKAGTDKALTKILIDFALEKADDDKSWDLSIDLNKVGKLLFDETHAVHLKNLVDKEMDAFIDLKKKLKHRIAQQERKMADNASQALRLMDSNGLEVGDFKAGYFPKFMAKIAQDDFNIDFKAGWKQNFETAALYNKSCPDTTKDLLNSLQPRFAILFNTIKDHFHSLLFLKNAYRNIVPLTVLNAIQKEVRSLELERDQLPISSFNSLISKEIKDQPAPFIYERLGEKYRHYFIDEFQDTSEMQWSNLIPLVSNALESEDELGELGSLLLVGDAKQAIYRWRGGKAEQFMDLIDHNNNPFVLSPEIADLPVNYRSHEEIIKFNNDFFSKTSPFLNNAAYQKLFVDGSKQEHNHKKGGAVQLDFITARTRMEEDELYGSNVLQTIRELLAKNFSLKDICILTRKKKQGIFLADYLTQSGIPIISSETLLLNSSEKVRFLIHVMQLSILPRNKEVSYEILFFLADKSKETHKFINTYLEQPEYYLRTKYDFYVERLLELSVYDGFEYAIKQFELATGSDAYLIYLMDVVWELEQKEGVSPNTFLAHWEKKKDKLGIVAPENLDAVQIMTVHKSKGLEFPIVIFPYANSNIYEEIEPKLWLPVYKKDFNDFGELLVSKKQDMLNYGEIAEHLYNEEQHKLELDAFNLLYVALTRAIKALYVVSKKDLTSKEQHRTDFYSGLFIDYLIGEGLWELDKSSYKFGELASCENQLVPRFPNENIPYQYSFKERPQFRVLTKSGMLWDTNRKEALIKGTLIHYILGLVETEKDLEPALERALRNGDIVVDDIDGLRTKIDQVLQHPLLHPYYKEGHTILNEREILTKEGTVLRPDRLVLHKNKVVVMDYKTGGEKPAHRQQLFAYAQALQEMGLVVEHKIIVYLEDCVNPVFI
ncbi:UvrD-helicase domain-containing protein [Flavobacteriaceae bacterium F89]|uniref:DNA 3'-5' helicase n=1 Tax=Cerina litoralis TaxID=2874477 RepID=A0AAE3JMZ6_9FLAO|nr:UvrD-helicase domain-containing protein [Cerina litoralis]MCG2459331.1 UvrD-helicase domain-containing protein [Cerina litoralis]